MRRSLDYAGFAQLCGRSPFMREIMRPHNCIIPRSLPACSLILSRIDYCNAVLHGAPSYSIKKLQQVQNNAARIVLEAPRRSHGSPLLRTLHWLPVQQRIQYKVALLTFKICSTLTPSYLRLLIQDREHGRNLRSTTTALSTFHNDNICETRFSMLCTSCLEFTTANCS